MIDLNAYDIVPKSEIPYGRYIFLHGFLESYSINLSRFSHLTGCEQALYFSELYDTEKISNNYYEEYRAGFDETYASLNDDLSKISMRAYLNAKINEDAAGLNMLVQKPQYFSGGFLKLSNSETLIDCGAFQGDSIADFVKATKGKYNKIYALEPDVKNIAGLSAYIKDNHIHDVSIIQKGASDKKERLLFTSKEEMSKIDEQGDVIILTDTIDAVVGDANISFIKMDIEGAELAALKGARNTIERCHPVLAISAYHKADDLISLFKQIKDIFDGYHFYFRLHKELAIDAILYAIPY